MDDTAQKPCVGDCIMFSTADWFEPYWTNKQHTARTLAELGWRVLYVESVGLRGPRAGSKRDRSRLLDRLRRGLKAAILGGDKVQDNIWVLPPLMIPGGHHLAFVGWLNRKILGLSLERSNRKYGFDKPLIWTYHPYMLGAIETFEHGPIVFHCVDDLSTVPGVDPHFYKASEKRLLETCQAVFVTAPNLMDICTPHNANCHFLPNVVDFEHFSAAIKDGDIPAEFEKIPEPRLVYHGVLSDFKLDLPLIYKAAQASPQWQWVIIGGEREGQQSEWIERMRTLPNVHLLGYRPYSQLPDYLRAMSVGLLPSKINEYTNSMFPMKYFEYLAAGLPVASTPLNFTRVSKAGLEIGDTPGAFLKAVEIQLKRGRHTCGDALQLVGENTWKARTRNILDIIQK